jgi:hypothetical protein
LQRIIRLCLTALLGSKLLRLVWLLLLQLYSTCSLLYYSNSWHDLIWHNCCCWLLLGLL